VEKKTRKILLIAFLVIIFSLTVGLVRQVVNWVKKSDVLKQKQAQLRVLEEEGRQLRAKKEEIDNPAFLEREAARVFGISKDGNTVALERDNVFGVQEPVGTAEPLIPVYRKWLKLFF